MKKTKQNGFTLLEVLIVVAIIGLLSVASILMLNKTREEMVDASRHADLKMLWSAIELYVADNGSVPNPTNITNKWSGPTDSLQSLLLKYLPGGLPGNESLNARDWIYCWNIGNNKFLIATTVGQNKDVVGDIDKVYNWTAEECISSDVINIKPDCGREYLNDETKEKDNIIDSICDAGNPCNGKGYYCNHGLCDKTKCMSVTKKPNCFDFNNGTIDDFSSATSVCLGSDDVD